MKQLPVYYCGETYKTCSDLPLRVWLNVNLTKDVKFLIKTGTVNPSELVRLWTIICDEFRQLMEDIDSTHEFNLQKEIFVEDKFLILITAVVNQLRLTRNEDLISVLKNDFHFRLNYTNLERDLDITVKQAKFRSIQLRQKENEYKSLTVKKEGKSFTEYDFYEQLDVISESRGYHLKIDDLTVLEYTAIYNRFKRDIENKIKNAQ